MPVDFVLLVRIRVGLPEDGRDQHRRDPTVGGLLYGTLARMIFAAHVWFRHAVKQRYAPAGDKGIPR